MKYASTSLFMLLFSCADDTEGLDPNNKRSHARVLDAAATFQNAQGDAVKPGSWEETLLLAHNTVRRQLDKEGLNDLAWNDQLANDAATYAQALSLRCQLSHDGSLSAQKVGENLALYSEGFLAESLSFGVEQWALEAESYDHEAFFCEKEPCGHYTQMIWSGTRLVGCGASSATCRGREVEILVCRYFPAGNVEGIAPY